MRVALDTNILVYAEDVLGLAGDAGRVAAARSLVARLPADAMVVPVQVLGELFNVLTRRGGRPAAAAHGAVLLWRDSAIAQDTTAAVLEAAVSLATAHHLQIWDAIILAAAAEAGCALLLSEDLQDGFMHRGVTVANPFAATPHPLLASLLRG